MHKLILLQEITFKTSSPTDPDDAAYPRADTKIEAKDGVSLLKSLQASVTSRSVLRRAILSNIAMQIGPDCEISVSAYQLFKRQEPARSSYVWLGGEKAQIANGATTQVAEDTARTVEKPEIRKAYTFGGSQVVFTQEEQQELRKFGEPVIRVVGTRPLSALRFWDNIKQSTFVYPSEDIYVGSTRTFSAFQQQLLQQKKMALVWFIPRKNAAPVLSAMIGGEEKLDRDSQQKIPPGMWIIPLPAADDMRSLPETILNVATGPVIEEAREILLMLKLPGGRYDPSRYPNPCRFC